MLVFRKCSKQEIDCYLRGEKYYSLEKKYGINTFCYDDNLEYIHFYLYPECCVRKEYYVSKDVGYIICDIPKEILKEYFGYGYYPDIVDGKYVPLPEFSIPKNLFLIDYIKVIESLDGIKKYFDSSYGDYLNKLDDSYMIDYKTGKLGEGKSIYSILCKSI